MIEFLIWIRGEWSVILYSSKIFSNHVSFICNLKTVSWADCG